MNSSFLHEFSEFKELIEITAQAENIKDPVLVEKDYWLMHILWCLQKHKFHFHLKGGTSLSKGYGCIHRFSEDIDIKIEPDEKICGFKVYSGKNHDDEKHRQSRKKYFDWICHQLSGCVSGIHEIKRDEIFDDKQKFRNGGIRLYYPSHFITTPALKDGLLLEIGFDRTIPNQQRIITSWAFERARNIPSLRVIDNRALDVCCYEPTDLATV